MLSDVLWSCLHVYFVFMVVTRSWLDGDCLLGVSKTFVPFLYINDFSHT